MQYIGIDYSNDNGMGWLTSDLQELFRLASEAPNEITKQFIYGLIAEKRYEI